MKKAILLVLLGTTVVLSTGCAEAFHRTFHHPFHTHEHWQEHHRDHDRR